ncbi:hypothetical protein LZ906_012995 [Paraclostridium ghonii]|uniref:hypothetical protein n=1 Tax=Paraclostridium ghonii TaxID=29358 RepID=UPI00202CEF64|nr:hypothetical protein [Paeniclostridium ghonii]MCM0164860.1 hypothetical protein [Paeniclostridium ghonii]
MVMPICLGILFGLSIIFDGYMENIFIIVTTIALYTYFIYYEKNYKSLFIGFLLSFFIINISIMVFIKDDIKVESIEHGDIQDETLVMLVYDGESKKYNLRERANEIYFDQGYKSYLTSMYNLHKYKGYYDSLGTSEFKDTAHKVSSGLRSKLGPKYKVVDAYMYTKPYFENMVQEVVELGYKNIIICPMFITQGKDFELFNKRLDSMELNKYGVNVKLTDVFYKSDNLAKSYTNEILGNIKNEDVDSGVLLIGLADENNLEQDIIFREKIKNYIEKEKNTKIQIKLPLLENNKDDIIKSGEQLLEFGVDVLHVVIPTCTIDNMYNKNLVESILKELDTSEVRFHYIEPKDKVKILIDEMYTQIQLIEK